MSEGNREMLLKTRGLTKQFGKHVAVDHVDMHIRRGAIYGFIGRNGAGKTTVLKMIAGLADPTAGEYEIFGCSGKSLAKVRSRVGCLIEQPGLYPNMSAQDNLMIKAELFGIRDKKYAEELLELVGLVHAGRKKTKHFSLGMKQRLGIALALVGNPDFLVLDEPINGLDPQGIVEIRDMLQRLSEERNITILISSHILEELSKLCTDFGIIHNGVLLQEISQEHTIVNNPKIRTQLWDYSQWCVTTGDFAGTVDTAMQQTIGIYIRSAGAGDADFGSTGNNSL